MVLEVNDLFISIEQGLNEAIAFSKDAMPKAVIHQYDAIDVKRIRHQVGMSQTEFAQAVGISVATLRHWERGDRQPKGPALVLLNLVGRNPQMVMQTLISS